MWRNGSDGRTAGLYTIVKSKVKGSITGVSKKCGIVQMIIPACLIKQPNSTLIRIYELRANYISGLNE